MDKEKVKKYLEENLSVAVDVARECDAWDGRFGNQFDTWDLAEMVNCYCCDYESTRRFMDIMLNSLDTLPCDTDTPVRFSEFGEYIETADDDTLYEEVSDLLIDIVDSIEELYPADISIWDNELKELVEEDDEHLSYKGQLAKHAQPDPLEAVEVKEDE